VQPTLGFQRVLQRAVFHVQSSGKKEVTAANVLVAIFSEKQSHAAYLLGMQDVARLDVVNYISHGLAKLQGRGRARRRAGRPGVDRARGRGAGQRARQVLHQPERWRGRPDRPADRPQLEVERTIQILCRRRKNNPLYVGEAGVGKTAIAEGSRG
jgi:ATP-dependent Clp protease ATP-binding subunit ClpA